MCRPMITYPPQANVLVQRMRRTNSYAASRGDKTVMRPFAKLLCTLVYYSRGIFRKKNTLFVSLSRKSVDRGRECALQIVSRSRRNVRRP